MSGDVNGGDGLLPEDRALLERMARWLAERRLSVPAVLFLESVKPLHFVGSQALIFFEPMVKAVSSGKEYGRFASILESREGVESFLVLIETEEARMRAPKPGKP